MADEHRRHESWHALAPPPARRRELTGLRLCGIVDEPPRPAAAGSNASPTSVCIEQRHVARDLAQRADEEAQRRGDFDDAIAMRMPRHVGQREVEFCRQRGRDGESLFAERRERARGAAELQDGDARGREGVYARAMSLDRAQRACRA